MKKRIGLVLFLSLVVSYTLMAQNPIISGQFTADPTARVFDGKIYLYPSHDIPSPIERLEKWFCMADYHVFSSANMTDWTDHGVIVTQNEVPWVQPDSYSMWAPECVTRNGKYYFYFPSTPRDAADGKGFAVGVAIADKPYGPFTPLASPIEGVKGIDPCVFIDKDNQAYIYWCAGGKMFVAKLKDNMTELASEPSQIENLPQGFMEGPFVFERNGVYYFTFPWVQDKTETLAYATGSTPMGPFQFEGLIMDQWPSACWTNHHSILEYQKQWYLFYHHNDYSPEFDKNRSARIDSLFFNSDGTIQKVKPTLRGVGVTQATDKIQLDRYSDIGDGAKIDFVNAADKFEGWKTIFNKKNSWIQYNSVNFGKISPKLLKIKVMARDGGTIQVRTQHKEGPVIAEIKLPELKRSLLIESPVIKEIKGIRNLFVVSLNNQPLEVDWISFE
ncbi:family 43 glycosylhydrolase [Bacteroides sp. 51]|uniref:family 43 glycosylhydrolase n=1 Tax=Bacteroides sp. 51 TaxID=2302938 RepID=UPI0013D74A7D|nr:family 43 glycosylhydrolase [Bacteroides sp. 51]NDV81607.1 alpha-N-arabinofuranosidase [Bacteroides sp. 51]